MVSKHYSPARCCRGRDGSRRCYGNHLGVGPVCIETSRLDGWPPRRLYSALRGFAPTELRFGHILPKPELQRHIHADATVSRRTHLTERSNKRRFLRPLLGHEASNGASRYDRSTYESRQYRGRAWLA